MGNEVSVVFLNQLSELERLNEVVETFALEHGLASKLVFEINLALDELLTNVISYAFKDTEEHQIQLWIQLESGLLTLRLEDDGIPFDPTRMADPDVDLAVEDREIGGLGVFFVKKVMDGLDYKRVEERNVITLTKSVG
jgi:anti-sigma regulatory factor (Ser/Thr protein kinase)